MPSIADAGDRTSRSVYMKPQDRVHAALQHEQPDRVPRFEIWIDALLDELGQDDPAGAYVNLGQDCVMMPTRTPSQSNVWRNGVDEWGRVWQDGTFVGGVVDTDADLETYRPPLDCVDQMYNSDRVRVGRESP